MPAPRQIGRLVGTSGGDSRPGDDTFLVNLQKWTQAVKLGGSKYTINFKVGDVVQAPRTVMNVQSYGVLVRDTKLLLEIMKRTEKWETSLRKEADGALKRGRVTHGVLNLHRRQFVPNSQQRDRLQIENRRDAVVVRDDYWLDIYFSDERNNAVPLVRVYHDSIGSIYFRQPLRVASFARELTRYASDYAAPKDITLNWHDAARVLGLDRTLTYLRACLHGSNFPLTVLVQTAGLNGVLSPPFTGGWYPDLNGFFQPIAPTLFDPSESYFDTVAGLQLGATAAALNVLVYQVRNDDHSAWRDPQTGEDISAFPSHNVRRVPRQLPFDQVPQPAPPSSEIADALGRLFVIASGGRAIYIGSGYFVFRADEFAALAAGTSRWGSGELMVVFIEKAAESGAASTVAGGVGAVGAVLTLAGTYLEEEANPEQAIQDCISNSSSVSECKDCVASKLGLANGLQIGGDFVGALGGALGAMAATGPVGWVIGAIVVITCVAIMAYDVHQFDEQLDQCNGNYG